MCRKRLRLIYFLITRTVKVHDSAFIDGLHMTPAGRWLLEELPKGAISEDKAFIVLSYARIMAHFNCFIGLEDANRLLIPDLRCQESNSNCSCGFGELP